MPKTKKSASRPTAERPARIEPLRSEEKIARLLGLIAIQGIKWKPAQTMMLRGAGFTNAEMAEMLDITDNAVSVLIYTAKKGKKADATD
jgi:hypothetical protein